MSTYGKAFSIRELKEIELEIDKLMATIVKNLAKCIPNTKIPCECGAHKVDSHMHSTWCSLYEIKNV